VVAAASVGAQTKRAWVIERQFAPANWLSGRAIDLAFHRIVENAYRLVWTAEVKWWRDSGAANAANRRRDLVADFIRAASVYPDVESGAFVTLLATEDLWASTLPSGRTAAKPLRDCLFVGQSATTYGQWTMKDMATNVSAVKIAIWKLNGDIQIPNIFHTELAAVSRLTAGGGRPILHALDWRVRKPQRSRFLDQAEIDAIVA